jgi:hypothetical protein
VKKLTVKELAIDLFNEKKFVVSHLSSVNDELVKSAVKIIAYGYDNPTHTISQFVRDIGDTYDEIQKVIRFIRSAPKAIPVVNLVKKHFKMSKKETIFLTRVIESTGGKYNHYTRLDVLRNEFCQDWLADDNIYNREHIIDMIKLPRPKKLPRVTG